jgi:hypothetical protein
MSLNFDTTRKELSELLDLLGKGVTETQLTIFSSDPNVSREDIVAGKRVRISEVSSHTEKRNFAILWVDPLELKEHKLSDLIARVCWTLGAKRMALRLPPNAGIDLVRLQIDVQTSENPDNKGYRPLIRIDKRTEKHILWKVSM